MSAPVLDSGIPVCFGKTTLGNGVAGQESAVTALTGAFHFVPGISQHTAMPSHLSFSSDPLGLDLVAASASESPSPAGVTPHSDSTWLSSSSPSSSGIVATYSESSKASLYLKQQASMRISHTGQKDIQSLDRNDTTPRIL
jgi:hypothetical protein